MKDIPIPAKTTYCIKVIEKNQKFEILVFSQHLSDIKILWNLRSYIRPYFFFFQ